MGVNLKIFGQYKKGLALRLRARDPSSIGSNYPRPLQSESYRFPFWMTVFFFGILGDVLFGCQQKGRDKPNSQITQQNSDRKKEDKTMLKTIYDEQDLRNKLSQYANERIESIACDGVQIRIIFKEGYATSFLSADAYDTEIYFYSVTSMKEACKKVYLVEGQENLEKAKAEQEKKEQEEKKEPQEQEEKKEEKKMKKDIVKAYVNIEEKEGYVKTYYKDLQEKTNALIEMVANWTKLGWWKEWNYQPYMRQGAESAVTDVYFFAELIIEQDKSEALTVLAIMKDLFENVLSDTPIDLGYFWNAFDRISKNLEQPKQEEPKEEKKEDKAPLSPSLGERERELLNLENESKEITSLRLDLTESEREAIHYLFELEKDRRNNGNEWTDKEKAHAQKALDTLTDLGILDTFPNLQDFEPSLEDLDQFKFYKSESFYEGGYLPTSQAIEFLELTYQEIIDHDKVMALLQIPLNVLNVTEFIEVLKYNILRIHLKQGYQYQGSSFIDTTVGQYQAFDILNNLQEQGSLFDFENLSFEELENALFDVDEELDRFECIEEKTFSNNHHYHNVPYNKAKQLAQQVAEVTTGTTKDKLLDKRIRITKAIEQLSQLNKDVLRL